MFAHHISVVVRSARYIKHLKVQIKEEERERDNSKYT